MNNKVNGYRILLIDDTKIEAIPNKYGFFEIEIDDILITINNGKISINGKISTSKFIPELISIDAAKINKPTPEEFARNIDTERNDDVGTLRTCIRCESRSYCITNGCARTPYGTICDNM